MKPIAHFFSRRLLPTLLSLAIAAPAPLLAQVANAETPASAGQQRALGSTATATWSATEAGKAPKGKKAGVRNRISPDLAEEVDEATGDTRSAKRNKVKKKNRWSQEVRGARMVQVIVTSDAEDPALTTLRADIERLGGQVQAVHSAFKTMTVVLPTRSVRRVAKLDDVVSIAPNRDTQSTASVLEGITGTQHASVRSYTSTTSYTGLDGSGVGIAILDSGVMAAHRSFRNALGTSRVQRSVSMLKADVANWSNTGVTSVGSLRPGSLELTSYDNRIAAGGDSFQDPFGHGTHVASVAAGRGFYQSPDSTGVAPNANLYDVRVLGANGSGTVSDALEGINWVMYNARSLNIRVMNLSLAADSTDPWDYDPLCHAVRAATAMGITVVVAAGNYGLNSALKQAYGSVAAPGNDPSVITVGAVNFKNTNARGDDSVTQFSSRGPTRAALDMGTWKWYDNVIKPDLVAPGNRVIGANSTNASSSNPTPNFLTTSFPVLASAAGGPTTYGQRLIMLSGTSVAAPVVAGAVAVLLQANPGLTPPLIKAILQYTAQPLPNQSLVEQGAGAAEPGRRGSPGTEPAHRHRQRHQRRHPGGGQQFPAGFWPQPAGGAHFHRGRHQLQLVAHRHRRRAPHRHRRQALQHPPTHLGPAAGLGL